MSSKSAKAKSEVVLNIENVDVLMLLGENNSKLNLLKKSFPDVSISSRGTRIKLTGDKAKVQDVKEKIEIMIKMIKQRHDLSLHALMDIINGSNPMDHKVSASSPDNSVIVYGKNGKPIKAKTVNQKKMVKESQTNDIVFAIGPAGTGKTYTAVALAVAALKSKVVKKIILTRPAVEAGESLGFLPGDLKDKIDPYLRPLYDALDDLLPGEKLKYFMENRTIEVAPLAFMRGRTLDNAFIILDEAQNCTSAQLKMFLTRLGPSAKCIITGDLSQIDLPRNQTSGLYRALDILTDIDGISDVRLTGEDVVRHRLVKQIINRYDISDKEITDKKEKERKERIAQKERELEQKKEK